MKLFILILVFILAAFISFAQKLHCGTYIFKYCDYEYNKCLSTCKVIIIGNKIKLYALEGLSVPKGELLESGIIMKHKSGKWIIGKSKKDIYKSKNKFEYGFPEIDFKRRRVWQF